MKRLFAIILVLVLFFSALFIFFKFSHQERPVLAQTCQDNDGVCPEGCTSVNDNDCCEQIDITISPDQETYTAGQIVTINVSKPSAFQGDLSLFFTRTSANSRLGLDVWHEINLDFYPLGGFWYGQWTIPEELYTSNPYEGDDFNPYQTSKNQEFVLAVNLMKDGQLLCTGNPDPGPEFEDFMCENCYKILVTRDEPSGPILDLDDFWKAIPGYSYTYQGERLDDPKDDNGNSVDGSFITRMEYEAPVQICDEMTILPQRFTKTNRWGYWGAANPDPNDLVYPEFRRRTGSPWTDGEQNLRFFITTPGFDYQWNNELYGTFGFKMYQIAGISGVSLSDLGGFDRSYITTSLNHENYYYPPYFLSYSETPITGIEEFIRKDSIYVLGETEEKSLICQSREKNENHYWYLRTRLLTDSQLKQEFNHVLGYFPSKEIVVLIFFETGQKKLYFREDWYLMEGVGLVGIDQAVWDKDDITTAKNYFYADFMKEDTNASPHLRMRAVRAYIGEPLTVSVSPAVVEPGGNYTLEVYSANSGMPYDGYLDYEDGWGGVHLLTSPIDGEPVWVENGSVVIDLPEDFSVGEYTTRFRSHIVRSSSNQETIIPPSEMPWSNAVTLKVWVKGDLDHDGNVDFHDIRILLQNWGGSPGLDEADLNYDNIVNGLDFGIILGLL